MPKPVYLSRKPESCPKCGHKPVATILFGMPADSEELQKELDSGKTVLGGCCITIPCPTWKCTKCKRAFYSEKERQRLIKEGLWDGKSY